MNSRKESPHPASAAAALPGVVWLGVLTVLLAANASADPLPCDPTRPKTLAPKNRRFF